MAAVWLVEACGYDEIWAAGRVAGALWRTQRLAPNILSFQYQVIGFDYKKYMCLFIYIIYLREAESGGRGRGRGREQISSRCSTEFRA